MSPRQHDRLSSVTMPPKPVRPGRRLLHAARTIGARGSPCTGRSGQGWLDLAEIDHGAANLAERTAVVRESAGKTQEAPVNNAIPVGKHPRFMPNGTYAPLETALVQINAWLAALLRGEIETADAAKHASRLRPLLHPRGGALTDRPVHGAAAATPMARCSMRSPASPSVGLWHADLARRYQPTEHMGQKPRRRGAPGCLPAALGSVADVVGDVAGDGASRLWHHLFDDVHPPRFPRTPSQFARPH